MAKAAQIKKKRPTAVDTPPLPANGSAAPAEEDIARRAFELYCERGGEHGHDLEDWLRAEAELRTSDNQFVA
jgi:Protein of unknown function (DUF2934)